MVKEMFQELGECHALKLYFVPSHDSLISEVGMVYLLFLESTTPEQIELSEACDR